jgi:D-alanyl-D-alanine carboxypeptidase
MRRVTALVAAAVVAVSIATATPAGTTGFRGTVSAIGPSLRAYMTGRSWHPGCPVPISRLRLLTLTYWGFDHRPHTGKLVVNADVSNTVVSVFRRLYDARFPIRRMQLVDDYGGSDFQSIEADNTSAFNCRAATGSTHWSNHAYGHAIDVNTIENPYVDGGRTSHPASRPYLDRSWHRPGMAYPGGVLVQVFAAVGWGWGGSWSGSIHDYQHFSVDGR